MADTILTLKQRRQVEDAIQEIQHHAATFSGTDVYVMSPSRAAVYLHRMELLQKAESIITKTIQEALGG